MRVEYREKIHPGFHVKGSIKLFLASLIIRAVGCSKLQRYLKINSSMTLGNIFVITNIVVFFSDNKMTTRCTVCFKTIQQFPGLFKDCCGIWLCDTCNMTLAEHCPICQRGITNRVTPCSNCGTPKAMFQSRVCRECDSLCCVACSQNTNCCVEGAVTVCTCVKCNNC